MAAAAAAAVGVVSRRFAARASTLPRVPPASPLWHAASELGCGHSAAAGATSPSSASRWSPAPQRRSGGGGGSALATLDPALTAYGGCLQLPGFACQADDYSLVEQLLADIEGTTGALRSHRSNQHLQVWGEQLKHSAAFSTLMARLMETFDLELVDCWANLYRDADRKSWHQDNYQDRKPRPTVTVGASLGGERCLGLEGVARGPADGQRAYVPMRNGDVFAFDSEFNRHWRHSVPVPRRGEDASLRVSVIAWAREPPRRQQSRRGGRLGITPPAPGAFAGAAAAAASGAAGGGGGLASASAALAVREVVRCGGGFPQAETARWDDWDLRAALRGGAASGAHR